jgi:AcrR family transcriptional regulator
MTKPARNKKRTRNPAQTRLKLLQATVDLVADKGPDALSLKAATRRAKLSRGVAYQHFRDRNHLLSEVKSWISDRLADGVRQLEAAPIEERTRYGARLVLNNRKAAKLMIVDALAGKNFSTHHPLYKLVRKMLRESLANGVIRKDVDLEVLIYIMLGTNATMLMLGETHKSVASNDLADRFAAEWSHILTRGILSTVPK